MSSLQNNYLSVLFALAIFTGFTRPANAQIIYAEGYMFNNYERYMLKIDLATCEVCAVKAEQLTYNAIVSHGMLSDGTIIRCTGTPAITHEAAPPSSAIIWGGGTGLIEDVVEGPGGVVYLTGAGGLSTYNPVTHVITSIGPWPAGGWCNALYYMNGVLHGAWYPIAGGNHLDLIVNVTNPIASTTNIVNPPYLSWPREMTWNGVDGVAFLTPAAGNTGGEIRFFDPATNGISTICSFAAPIGIIKISSLPPVVPDFPCIDPCVTTFAGAYNNAGPYNGCNAIFFPGITNTDINPSEVVNYILYSDPNDPLGSIITVSTGSYFFYNGANMSTGVNYYAAAIAGNNVGGYVNLSDPCVDVSDSLIVQFTNRPAVSFTAAPPEICPGGCQTITATFTGVPPFTLAGQVLAGSTVVGTFNQSFPGNSGTFTVCAPANIPPGPIEVQATSLSDATCNCN